MIALLDTLRDGSSDTPLWRNSDGSRMSYLRRGVCPLPGPEILRLVSRRAPISCAAQRCLTQTRRNSARYCSAMA